MEDIVVSMLVTGNTLISRIKKNDGMVQFDEPLEIHVVPTGNAQTPIGIALVPALVYAKEDAWYPESIIAATPEPKEELVAQYVKMTSGIILAKPNVVV
jgi:hypothetical protein